MISGRVRVSFRVRFRDQAKRNWVKWKYSVTTSPWYRNVIIIIVIIINVCWPVCRQESTRFHAYEDS